MRNLKNHSPYFRNLSVDVWSSEIGKICKDGGRHSGFASSRPLAGNKSRYL